MARGGARPGAGRPKGSRAPESKETTKTEKALQSAKPGGKRFETALDFAMEMINDPEAPMADRVRLAIAAMPFQHPKLEPRTQGKKDEKAEAAKAAGSGKFKPSAPPRLVSSNI